MTAPVPYWPSSRTRAQIGERWWAWRLAPDSGQRSAQFLPVAAIAAVAETAEPVVAMGEAQTTVRVRTTSPRLRPL
jgi:hypothetical protein